MWVSPRTPVRQHLTPCGFTPCHVTPCCRQLWVAHTGRRTCGEPGLSCVVHSTVASAARRRSPGYACCFMSGMRGLLRSGADARD